MLAEKLDDAWEIELGIRDFVAREERRGHVFFSDNGARHRHQGLTVAFDRGFISRKDLSIGFGYQVDWNRFHHEFRCPSTLEYQSRVTSVVADDLILAAGLRLRRWEAELTTAERVLVRRVCGEDRIVGDALMSQLTYVLRKIGIAQVERWAVEREDLAPLAVVVGDLRGLAAEVRHRYQMGAGYIQIGAQDVLRVAQGGLCGICSKPIWPERGSLDHVVPKGHVVGGGGFGGPGNLLLTHGRCNIQRGHDMPSAEMLRCLARANAVLGWDVRDDNDPEDQWQVLTEALVRLPMAEDDAPELPRHWPVPDPGVKSLGMSAREWARRKVALERTLRRLEKLKAEPERPAPQPRYRPPPATAAAEPEREPEWTDLLPAKPSKDDSAMAPEWLAGVGVVRANREMRHMGVQAKTEKRMKDKAHGKIRKRVRRRGRS